MHRAVKRVAQSGHQKKRGIGPAHTLNPILTIFGMWGGPMDMFLKFEFRVGRSPNFEATGGQKSPFSYSTHIAYTTACCYRTSCEKLTIKLRTSNGDGGICSLLPFQYSRCLQSRIFRICLFLEYSKLYVY